MSAIRDVFFGSRLRTVLVAVLLLAGAIGGAVATGVLGAPEVDGVENRFAGVNETTTTIESAIRISNPNPVGVSLGDVTVDYAVEMNGLRMAAGEKRGVSVDSGESELELTTRMDNEKIPAWWVSHVRNGERTDLAVRAQVRSDAVDRSFDAPTVTRDVDTDIISQFNSTETRAIRSESALAPDPIAYVNETSARWGEVTDDRTPVRIAFEVYNPNSYPIAVSELGYDVTMNEVAVGNGTTDREHVIPPKSSETVETTVVIRNDELDEWWASHVERNQVTDLRIDFHAKFDAGGAGTVRVPLDPLTYERTIETDIFGTKPADAPTPTPEGDGSPSDEAATADGTTEDGASGEPTSERTDSTDDGGLLGGTATSSPTAAPTPTPDDGAESTPGDATDETTAGATTGASTTEETTDGGGLLDP